MELFEGGLEGAGGERGGFGAEAGVEFVGGEIEDVCEVGEGEVAFGDAVVALENGAEDELGFPAEAVAHGSVLGEGPALGGREGRGGNGGGEGVKKHLVEGGVERAEREEAGAVEEGEAALVRRAEEERMQRAGGGEAEAETAAEGGVDGAAGVGPRGFAAHVGEDGIEGEFGALEGHGHAVAGERRDHRGGVAEADFVGERDVRIEIDGGDGAERSGVEAGAGEAVGEGGEMGGFEVGEEESGAVGAEGATLEEAAEVDAAVFDAGEADVGVGAEMDFEVAGEREVERVEFEAEPAGGGAAAAGGEDAAGGVGGVGAARVGLEDSAGGSEGVGEAVIERVAAEAEGG